MPRIAQLKEIDGQLWARLEINETTPSPVTILTDEEIDKLRRDAVLNFQKHLYKLWIEKETRS